MNVFIYSVKKCAVSVGCGSYAVCDKNLGLVNIKKSDCIDIFCGAEAEPSRYCHDKSFCKNIAITGLYGDILIYPIFKPLRNRPYKVIMERSVVVEGVEHIITVYTCGSVLLKCTAYGASVTVEAPFVPEKTDVMPIGGSLFLVDLVAKKHFIVIFSAASLKTEFSCICDGYTVNDVLSVTKVHRGINVAEETTTYVYDGKVKPIETSFVTKCPYKALPDEVIPLAFLEEVRLCADYSHFLSDDLAKNKDMIKSFLGRFIFALPPFFKEFGETYAIVGDTVKYLKFDIKNGKINDICCEAFPFSKKSG